MPTIPKKIASQSGGSACGDAGGGGGKQAERTKDLLPGSQVGRQSVHVSEPSLSEKGDDEAARGDTAKHNKEGLMSANVRGHQPPQLGSPYAPLPRPR